MLKIVRPPVAAKDFERRANLTFVGPNPDDYNWTDQIVYFLDGMDFNAFIPNEHDLGQGSWLHWCIRRSDAIVFYFDSVCDYDIVRYIRCSASASPSFIYVYCDPDNKQASKLENQLQILVRGRFVTSIDSLIPQMFEDRYLNNVKGRSSWNSSRFTEYLSAKRPTF